MKAKHWAIIIVPTSVAIASMVFSVWFRANAQAYFVPSGSMDPTLTIGSRVIGWMHAYDSTPPKNREIALVQLPLSLVAPGTGSGTTTFVKRVIAVPGDRVEIKRGVLTLNGRMQSEPFAKWKTGQFYGPPYDMKVIRGVVFSREAGGPWTRAGLVASPLQQKLINSWPTQPLPANRFLILGDNRGNSNDSHVFGLVPRSTFIGRVGMQFYPHVHSF